MTVHVKLFAIVRDRAGVAETTLVVPPGTSITAAIAELGEQFPPIAALLPRVAYAVNRAYVPASTVLHDNDELALIPPVSGG